MSDIEAGGVKLPLPTVMRASSCLGDQQHRTVCASICGKEAHMWKTLWKQTETSGRAATQAKHREVLQCAPAAIWACDCKRQDNKQQGSHTPSYSRLLWTALPDYWFLNFVSVLLWKVAKPWLCAWGWDCYMLWSSPSLGLHVEKQE